MVDLQATYDGSSGTIKHTSAPDRSTVEEEREEKRREVRERELLLLKGCGSELRKDEAGSAATGTRHIAQISLAPL